MRAKKAFCMPLVLMLILGTTAIMTSVGATVPPGAPPGTVVWVEPPEYNATAQGKTVCDSFTIDVNIFNSSIAYGEGLWCFSFRLLYNSTLINATDVVPGPTIAARTDYFESAKVLTPGEVFYGGTLTKLPVLDIPGEDTLATVTFHIEYQPTFPAPDASCLLNLTEVTLGVGEAVEPPKVLTVYDGMYHITSTPPVPPVASFTENVTVAYVNETIGFDASASYDPDGWIEKYFWDFGDGTNATGVTTTHAYTAAGTYTVNLTVTDNDGLTDSATSTKTITLPPVGGYLDLYSSNIREYPQHSWTPHIGSKTDVPCDAFAPGENTTLYAKVTYNDAPVNHILVAFEIIFDPENLTGRTQCVAYRTAETNKTGIAEIRFRIPMPCEEDLMGKWIVIATAKVQSVKLNDTLPFDVGYILSIANVWTYYNGEPTNIFYRECDVMQINVEVKNIALISKPMCIVAVAYDECEVPIGQVIIRPEISAGKYCEPKTMPFPLSIHIPQWAYVGTGTLYINLFTCLPSECGVPYCPEASTTIIIKLGPRP